MRRFDPILVVKKRDGAKARKEQERQRGEVGWRSREASLQ
jgi:hypothetical protein